MLTSHRTLKFFRAVHLYFGVFISPALLFFAFTGAVQTFSLHETTAGSSYKPPAWLVTLGQIHKKQTTIVPVRRLRPPGPDRPAADAPRTDRLANPSAIGGVPGSSTPEASGSKPKSHLPLKLFFLLVSIGLFSSTLTGLYMAYKYKCNKLAVTGLLLAGVVLPLVLLPF